MRFVLWLFTATFLAQVCAGDEIAQFGFEPFPSSGCCNDWLQVETSLGRVSGRNYTLARQSAPGSAFDLFAADGWGNNVPVMGDGGFAAAAVSGRLPDAQRWGNQSGMTWSGWFRSEDELLRDGATLLSVPGHVAIHGGSGPSFGGLELTLWQNEQPLSITTQPISFDRPSDDWVFWAISFDQSAERGNVKFYRGTETDPVSLVTQATISSPVATGEPTERLSIGNEAFGDHAFQRPFVGQIDLVRVQNEALEEKQIEALRLDHEFDFSNHILGDFDGDSDVDSADRTIQTVGWTGYLPEFTGDRRYIDGDTDFDGDVDTMDQVTYVGNNGNACFSSPDDAILKYQPSTGNVRIENIETGGCGGIAAFSISDREGRLIPQNLVENPPGNAGPFFAVGTNTDTSPFQIGQIDPILTDRAKSIDLGNILPPGLAFTTEKLSHELDEYRYAYLAHGAYEFNLAIDLTTSGDADNDGDVDTADRTLLVGNWTGALLDDGGKLFSEGDFDGDGDVDTADATIQIRNWTGAQQANLASVPEPQTGLLMLFGIFVLAATRGSSTRVR